MQLDTGFNAAVRWQEPDPVNEPLVMVNVQLVGRSIDVATSPKIAAHLQHCAPGGSVGTFGNAFFEQGSLTIDLKRKVLRYATGPELAGDPAAQPMRYARWSPQGGHTLVEIRRAGKRSGYALLDSGSASLGFVPMTRSQWNRLTSSAPLAESARVRTFRVSTWNRQHTCFETSPTVRLQAGSWSLAHASVDYCPELGFTPPEKLEGIVGMTSFQDAVITIDYVSRRWLARTAP